MSENVKVTLLYKAVKEMDFSEAIQSKLQGNLNNILIKYFLSLKTQFRSRYTCFYADKIAQQTHAYAYSRCEYRIDWKTVVISFSWKFIHLRMKTSQKNSGFGY